MPRPSNPDLSKDWKLAMPATVAGRIEWMLLDAVHQKPMYGARVALVTALLENWIARESGVPEDQRPHVPTLAELREANING